MTEAIGWVASGLVILSLMAASVVRLRVIGLVATGAFITYGVLIEAWPIVITNAIVAVIHLWRLRGLLAVEEFFDVLHVLPTSKYLEYFCEFHAEDIRTFVPGYSYVPDDDQVAVFVLRNMIPAGVVIGVPSGEEMEIRLDYVIPRYRDFKVARYLYAEGSEVFTGTGVSRVWSQAETPRHRGYLKRMGFVREGDRWVLDLG